MAPGRGYAVIGATPWLLSPAKINLFLHINRRREDGYHELQTVFQLLDYGDRMRVKLREDDCINLHCANFDLEQHENLIDRAATLLRHHCSEKRGADIWLEKKLPVGGGLGGGSSNAATALLALNHVWGLGLGLPSLAKLGLQLGADVPVFVLGRSAWAEGIGEIIEPVAIEPTYYLILKPQCEVSTAQIFSHQELTRNTSRIRIAPFFEQGGRNDCEPIVTTLYPEVGAALKWLARYSPARLTGTGACVFARFQSLSQAEEVLTVLPEEFKGFVARGIDESPVHKALKLAKAN
jgi:4-diphosphocytidyl-2-C-methyl-D-erythritol kinase